MERGGYPQQVGLYRTAGSSATLAVSLVLLGASYVLLVAAPAVATYFSGLSQNLAHPVDLQRWVPVAAGGGLAIGGAAGLVFVLERLLRNVRHHPYACVAPTLALFSGALLLSLGASLPLSGVAPEVLGVFALALSVLGGSLIERQGVHVVLGWAVTFFPSVCLVGAVWSLSPRAELSSAIWSLDAKGRLFLLILAGTAAALALLATCVRATAASVQMSVVAEGVAPRESARDDTLELWLHQAEGQLTRRALSWWLYVALVPVLVCAGLAIRGRSSTDPQAKAEKGLTASPIEEPTNVRNFIEARASAAAQQEQQRASALLQPSVEQLGEPQTAEPQLGAPEIGKPQTVASQTAEAVLDEAQRSEQPALLGEVEVQALASAVAAPSPGAADESVAGPVPEVAQARVAARTKQAKGKPGRGVAKAPAAATKAVLSLAASAADSPGVESGAAPVTAQAKLRSANVEAQAAPKALAPTRGDESLDELMDRVVEPKNKRGKVSSASVAAAEDPIFGL